ncbi:MAG: sugar phosphate isomerase/epimerase [Cyclobacteriaceae bacterium]|jgi:sugar phosphate isomerase/epimerase
MLKNRRTFIKNTSLAAAAAIVMPSCITKSTSKMDHKIGLGLYTVRDQMMEDPISTLKKVAEIGYAKIETANYSDGKCYGFSAKDFRSIVEDLGLESTSGHYSSQVFHESFDQLLEFLVESNQQYAVFPYLTPEQRISLDQYKGYAEVLNRCAEKAKSANVTVCYHNHDFEFIELEGEKPMDVILRETDPKLVQIELDLYWISKVGLDPIDFFEQNKGRIPLWHMKDMANTPEQEFAEVGEGIIDFKSIMANKDISGMKHFFVEQDKSDDPMKSIALSYNNLVNKILV